MNNSNAMPFGLIERYRAYLPFADSVQPVSLGEGSTPLIPLTHLSQSLSVPLTIYAKFEGLNPTGSFKDRGMTVAVTQAVVEGKRAVLCASTGNTSASAAAYAARAGLLAIVLVPEGKIALGKLAQAVIHGARVLQIKGNFDDGMRLVKALTEDSEVLALVNSVNPYRLQGQKTAAFEIIDALGKAPDYHCLPVGNAGNISAYWMGYNEYQQAGKTEQLPKMLGYQASGAAPFLQGGPIAAPETLATAIRIGAPQSWDLAQAAQTESGGWFAACSDQEILQAQQLLASKEGIFCEPASAISVAGLLKDVAAGKLAEGATVVCTLTGHGLKDPDIIHHHSLLEPLQVDADYTVLKTVIDELMQGMA